VISLAGLILPGLAILIFVLWPKQAEKPIEKSGMEYDSHFRSRIIYTFMYAVSMIFCGFYCFKLHIFDD